MYNGKLCGLDLKNPVMNASGVFCNHPYLLKLLESWGCGAVVSKSITLDKKNCNPFDWDQYKILLIRGPDYIINSMGLPNKGSKWWREELNKYSFDVPLIVSVATSTGKLSDYQKIISRLEDYADIFEINVSCPNTGKQIIGCFMNPLEDLLSSLDTDKPMTVKLPCYYDKNSIKDYILEYDNVGAHVLGGKAKVQLPTKINEEALFNALDLIYGMGIKCVTSHNTIPVTHPILGPPRGGLSGVPIHDLAVMQAELINEYKKFEIIGVGGIIDYNSAYDFLEIENVRAIQAGTGLILDEHPKIVIDDLIKRF